MDIQKSTEEIMITAINNFSTEFGVKSTETQLMIQSSDEDGTPRYLVLKNNKVVREVTFNEILNVKLDFLGREIIASPFIAGAIRKLSREESVPINSINVLIYKQKEEQESPSMYCFSESKPIKPMTIKDIFVDME
jgi:hypothetical protein